MWCSILGNENSDAGYINVQAGRILLAGRTFHIPALLKLYRQTFERHNIRHHHSSGFCSVRLARKV